MEIKKSSINLLLGKIRTYLDVQPVERRKGKRFMEAEKALARLEKIFAAKHAMWKQDPCRFTSNVIP
jgi:hypothetical protein